ncbi:hypothetical protein LMH87_004284 [Akanthomyces muscarius]|uniref:Pyridoxamine kinase/Phosphomethylpyrimidine kinase domain-containing protein n=1 Tax=Akanthomyces muscarius TaxID=2231603 RepID=A0A9W8Q303_AKAMU|nr:hypothetical protein LMH87_004284 [Akanthomyces muscarius]KAJ4145433.1 hypothetical protein LMH87_004284 [Akanthomyces muscarius]
MSSLSAVDTEGRPNGMSPGLVLVFGCEAGPTRSFGVEADKRAIISQHVSATTVATATAARGQAIVPTLPSLLQDQIAAAVSQSEISKPGHVVTKIGAVLEPVAIQILSNMLSNREWTCVVDMEEERLPASHSEAMTQFRTLILPHATVLCTSVDEALALLDDAGAPVPHPRGIPDIQLIGIALRHLGPEYVVIKQEFLDEDEQTTTLLYVLCGPQEKPTYDRLRCANPGLVVGASFSIPSAIAARLAKGDDVPEAVSAAFEHVKSMIERGMIPDDRGSKKSDICIYQESS